MLQEAAAAVPRVPEPSGGLDRDAHFVWREVRERQVRHVEPGRAVLEHIDVVLRTEDAFLDRLGRLRPRDHPLDGLDLRRFHLAHPFERGPQDVGQGDALPRRPVPGDRVSAARTLREEPPLAARSADPQADLDLDRLLGSRLEQEPLGPSLVADREERVRCRLHLSRGRLLRAGHPSADSRRPAGLHGETRERGHEGEGILARWGRGETKHRSRLDSERREQCGGVALDDDLVSSDPVRGPEPHEPLPRFLVAGHDQTAVVDSPVGPDEFAEARQFLQGQIVEEQVVSRVERDAEVPRPREGLRSVDVLPAVRKRAELLAQERAVPLEGECPGHQDVVVLQELAEGHEDLPQIRDDPDARRETFRGFRVRDLDEVPRIEDDKRSLDPITRRDGAGLSRAFRLDLRSDRDEVVEDVHRRGMEGEGGETRGPRPTVSEPQAAGPTRMAEDRPARDDVLDEHIARLDTQFVFCVLGPRLLLHEVFVDELPSVDPEVLHVLLDLRRLQAHPVRDYEARAAADPVRLDPREVAMPAERIGPAYDRSTYEVPSRFRLILTPARPSSGATRIPSVRIARPTRTARSTAFSLLVAGRRAISFATRIASSSRS